MTQLATSGRTTRSYPTMAGPQGRSTSGAPNSRPRATTLSATRRVEAVSAAPRSGAGFMVLIGVIALLGIVALLMLNTLRAEQSFTVQRLQSDVTTLQQRQQQLQSDLSAVSSPENLAVKADALGMVRAGSVKYVRASDHKSLGIASVSGGGSTLNVQTLPNTPANRVATQMLADGTLGAHITDPVEAAVDAARAKAAADTAKAKAAADDAKAKSAAQKTGSAAQKNTKTTPSKH